MMLKGKGQVGAALIFLLPFILIFGFFLLSAAVVSMLKLPLALIGAVLAFFYFPKVLQDKLNMTKEYSLVVSGFIAGIVGLVIYKLPLFWIIVVLGILAVINYALEKFYGFSFRDAVEAFRG